MAKLWTRRQILAVGSSLLGSAGVAAVFIAPRIMSRLHDRVDLQRELVSAATPSLTDTALEQLQRIPGQAKDEIRRYFHGLCLNVHAYVAEICSESFAETLRGCQTKVERQAQFLVAFYQHVAPDAEILNRVELIADELGSQLDHDWAECCRQLSRQWNVQVQAVIPGHEIGDLSRMIEPDIVNSLRDAREVAMSDERRPALGETIDDIGKSALLLMPVVSVSPEVAVPLFVVLAFKDIYEYIMGQLNDRAGGYQRAISAELARLANHVGNQFDREIRQRLSDLHRWQQQAIREAAVRHSQDAIPLLL